MSMGENMVAPLPLLPFGELNMVQKKDPENKQVPVSVTSDFILCTSGSGDVRVEVVFTMNRSG